MSELLPDPDEVERLRGKLVDASASGILRRFGGQTFALGFMHGWTVRAAKQHAEECSLGGCVTCANFVDALSLFAAYSIEFPETLEIQFGTDK